MEWIEMTLEEAVEMIIEFFHIFPPDEIFPLIEFLNTLSFEELMEIFNREKHIIAKLVLKTERLEETSEVLEIIYDIIANRYLEIREKILEIINKRCNESK